MTVKALSSSGGIATDGPRYFRVALVSGYSILTKLPAEARNEGTQNSRKQSYFLFTELQHFFFPIKVLPVFPGSSHQKLACPLQAFCEGSNWCPVLF